MKTLIVFAALTLNPLCATENTNKPWQSQLNENESLAPQVVALLGIKELKENCSNLHCIYSIEGICRAIYNKQNIKKSDIDKAIETVGSIRDWVPTKTKKVADATWESYLKLKAKNNPK